MKHTITKLTPLETQSMVCDFLKNLGGRLKDKRTHINLSQEELAYCLDIDQTTLSKYESGDRDMQISLLPQFSTYCKFPIYELFPKEESEFILDVFSKAVTITVNRKQRQIELQSRRNATIQTEEKILKAQIFDVNGQEVYEPVSQKNTNKSIRERYRHAEIDTPARPYSEQEFCNYVTSKDITTYNSIVDAGQFLIQLESASRKDTLKNNVADYIIDELVINQLTGKKTSEESARIYAYYQRLYNYKMNTRQYDDSIYNKQH